MANIQVDLNIPDLEILKIETNKVGDLIITAESIKKSTLCHICGKKIEKIHSYNEAIILRHLPVFGQQVYIRIRPARFQCDTCKNKPTTTEVSTWYNQRSKFTKAYEDWLMRMLINSTISDVARKENTSYDDVEGVLNRQIETSVNWDDIEKITNFGLDEIALKKGHKDFVVIISAKVDDTLTVLAVLPDRKKETVKAFLQSIPTRLSETIKIACCDMYDGYVNAIKEVFSNKVKVVIDRFHVAKNYRGCVDLLRKKELRRLKDELNESEYARLKGAMWALRKKEEDLSDEDKCVLTALFEYSPALKTAYDFQKSLTNIFNSDIGKNEASLQIKDWIESVDISGLTCFDKFINTLNNNYDEILNYFYYKKGNSSGFVEGLNNKIKVLKRRCYGIFNVEKLFQRISLDLTGYERFA